MNCFRIMPRVVGKAVLLPAFLLPLILTAQSTLPHPILNTIYPCATQMGTTTEVTITGTDLEGASRLHFSAKGIECKPGTKPNVFTLTIAKDAPAGYCDVRVVGRYGISNPRGFAITKLPVVQLKDKALMASMGQVIVGNSLKQDKAIISFDAGEAVQILCKPEMLDSRMEPVVAIRDAASSVIARMDVGGEVNFTPTSDGTFSLELRDLMFRGDAEYPFVLSISKPGASGLEEIPALRPSEKLDADLSKPVVGTTYPRQPDFRVHGKGSLFTFATWAKRDVQIIELKLRLDSATTLIRFSWWRSSMVTKRPSSLRQGRSSPRCCCRRMSLMVGCGLIRFIDSPGERRDGTYHRVKLRNDSHSRAV